MTTFDIDNTCKTKYLEILESLVEQGHSLRAIHNPQTWRLSALTFALHLHDSIILFSKIKEKWSQRLPLSEAWDVDFTEWKSRIWSLVNDVSSFTEDTGFTNWQSLCEQDYRTFLEKANACLSGTIPLNDLLDFLSEKNTELKKVIIDSGQDLSALFSETEMMLYNTSSGLYELFYNDLFNIYLNENANPYQIEENGIYVPYDRWKASKSTRRLPDLILSKIRAANTAMQEIKFWQETWSECFDIEKKEIDKEGFARYIFQHRKRIIENKQYPCKNCLNRCFATLSLCEHLWKEHSLLLNPELSPDYYKEKVKSDIQLLDEFVKDEYKQIYPALWNSIIENSDVLNLLKEKSPNTFTGGYNQKLVCNIVGMMCSKGLYTKSKNQIDEMIYTDKTVYKYINEYAISDGNTNSALTTNVKQFIENILDNLS